jgi:hypothetical protein
MLISAEEGAERQKKLESSGYKGALAYAQISPLIFLRELAKIAHGFAVWNVGVNGFQQLLVPIIDGTGVNAGYWIGCNFPNGPLTPFLSPPSGNAIYQILPFETNIRGEKYLGCQIRLFATERPLTPVYIVIFGMPTA